MRQWYGVATGGLKWLPETFWKATLDEFFMALDGHNETHRPKGVTPLTRDELEDLEARYAN